MSSLAVQPFEVTQNTASSRAMAAAWTGSIRPGISTGAGRIRPAICWTAAHPASEAIKAAVAASVAIRFITPASRADL
jgi:DNA-binding transcriptional regulator YdaS (Cro superfamily)